MVLTMRDVLRVIWWVVTFGPERQLRREIREMIKSTRALLQRLERDDAERARAEAAQRCQVHGDQRRCVGSPCVHGPN